MKTYLVNLDAREEGDSRVLGPFATRDRAISAFRKWLIGHYIEESIDGCLDEFGGDLEQGEFNSEEHSTCILEREMETP